MIIDTHCHYNLSPLYDQWLDHWQNAHDHDVTGSIVVGTSVETSQIAIQLAEQNSQFFASIGIHPNECVISESLDTSQSYFAEEIIKLKSLVNNKKTLAIGECGLDYFRLSSEKSIEDTKQLQKNVLAAQIKLAANSNLPLIIHLRDKTEEAYWDFLRIFKATVSAPQPFILHCVSGPLPFIKECLDLGAYIGVAGNVTYNNSDAIRSIVATSPKDRLLLETDAPFLPPQQHRGKICEPWMIQLTEEYLKEYLTLDSTQFIENTVKLFPAFKTLL